MNKISISRDGRELGQYAPEEIRGLVMTGELVATDAVLHAPTGEWKPLASISEFAPLFGVEPALPAESGGSAAVAGNAPPPPDLPRSPPPPPPPSIPETGSSAEEEELIEQIKQWKWRKKKRGKVVMNVGLVLLLFTVFSVVQPIAPGLWVVFGAPGLVLVIIGSVMISAAANGLPPGMIPPPGYTAHTSSYYGGGCSSCGSGGDSGGGDGGGDGGGCGGGGCGGGD